MKRTYFRNGGMKEEKFINNSWRIVYEETPSGRKSWAEYDEKGNRIYSKVSTGMELWFDENLKPISKSEFKRIWKKVPEGVYILKKETKNN